MRLCMELTPTAAVDKEDGYVINNNITIINNNLTITPNSNIIIHSYTLTTITTVATYSNLNNTL